MNFSFSVVQVQLFPFRQATNDPIEMMKRMNARFEELNLAESLGSDEPFFDDLDEEVNLIVSHVETRSILRCGKKCKEKKVTFYQASPNETRKKKKKRHRFAQINSDKRR